MAGSSIGTIFKLTTFGESHGVALGGVIDGCPANITLDIDAIQYELDRRRPGQSSIVTQRKESDEVQFLSGIFEGRTTGTPIGFIIKNEDSKSKDYDHVKDVFRPSHADYVYQEKYNIRDYRGGGRSSARETVCRVVAGAIAKQILKECSIRAYVSSVGALKVTKPYNELDFDNIEKNAVRCPDLELGKEMENYIKEVRKQGDSIGGIITCVIQNIPKGLGEPVFDKLDAELAKAMLSINAVKGISFGSGFEGTELLGSQHNDIILPGGNTVTNYAGGIVGGISNGMDIVFKVAFKPVATLMRDQESINTSNEVVVVQGKGRHDACVVPRAVPIVEAMAAIVLTDMFLLQQSRKL